MKQTKVQYLISDNEPAWTASEFKVFLNSNDIQYYFEHKNQFKGIINTNDESRGNHQSTAIIDRLCQTLRNMHFNIGRQFEAIDPDEMQLLINEYNKSPHSTLGKYLGQPTSPNMMTDRLEDEFVYKLLKENLAVELSPDYDITGQTVQVMNEYSFMDKVKPKLIPGKWEVIQRDGALFTVKRDKKELKVPRWYLKI
jgi:hypothetical protein